LTLKTNQGISDGYMANTGLLILDWPFVMGCDAAGVIVKAGSKAVGPLGPFKAGDEVLGCTRLGSKGYSSCQEYVQQSCDGTDCSMLLTMTVPDGCSSSNS